MNKQQIVETVKDKGYLFLDNFIDQELLNSLRNEIRSISLEYGNHIHYPINKDKPNEVSQSHSRGYYLIEDQRTKEETPIALGLCYSMAKEFSITLPELKDWLLCEIGYQSYEPARNDRIGAHKDRVSDYLMSVTVTISGSAEVIVFDSEKKKPNYKTDLFKIDSHITKPGTVMFLRAPGLGSGKQMIHEVMPPNPEFGVREILNLRMRRTLLPKPTEQEKVIPL